MNFFTKMALIGATNIEIKIVVKDGLSTVSVIPKSQARDKAIGLIKPIVLTGTPEEIDENFFDLITEPIEKTVGVISNIESQEKSVDEAAKVKAEEDKKKADAAKAKASKGKTAPKTEKDSDDDGDEGEDENEEKIVVKDGHRVEEKTKVPKEKPAPKEKPVPPNPHQKYEDKVTEIVSRPEFRMKTHQMELKDAVWTLLVVDKANKIGKEWETKIKDYSPLFDEEEDYVPPAAEPKLIIEPGVADVASGYKSSFEKAIEATAVPLPPAEEDEANPFDDVPNLDDQEDLRD